MSLHPLVIIGSGPAGYTAGLYAARAQLAPLILAGHVSGGQLMSTTEVENFPGASADITGPKLMTVMREQAERFGALVKQEQVARVDFSRRPFSIWLESGGTKSEKSTPHLTAEAVIIATGASSVMLGVPGEKELLGRGVSTCAVCDAAFYRDQTTVVVGGGDSAMEDALALTKFAASVTIIHRRASFKASQIMQTRVLKHPKIKVIWNSRLLEIKGDQQVRSLVIETEGKERRELAADGVFVAIGHRPVSQLFLGQLELDESGYLVTRQSLSLAGHQLASDHFSPQGNLLLPTSTSVEGVFAAGDVVDVRYKQAITAAAQGAQAALDAERWLSEVKA